MGAAAMPVRKFPEKSLAPGNFFLILYKYLYNFKRYCRQKVPASPDPLIKSQQLYQRTVVRRHRHHNLNGEALPLQTLPVTDDKSG